MHRSLVQQRQGRLSLGAVATRDHLLFWAVAAVTSKEDEKFVVWFFFAFWGGLRRPSIVRLFLFLHIFVQSQSLVFGWSVVVIVALITDAVLLILLHIDNIIIIVLVVVVVGAG